MIEDGERAPAFELPAVVEGEIERVALEDALGRDILVLAFYPADFNPACSDDVTDLDAFDSLGLQADVTALALSSDSVYSHRAFADAYDLRLPLLADVYGAVAEAYGVAVADESAGYRTRRAVVVIDHDGRVAYTWVADSIEALPDVDELRDVVARVGDRSGDDSADSDTVDDEELEEIASELERQTEAATTRQAAEEAADDTSDDADKEWSTLDDPEATSTADADGRPASEADAADIEGDLDADDIELDLADPTEGEDGDPDTDTEGEADGADGTDGETDVGTGDRGVSDSP